MGLTIKRPFVEVEGAKFYYKSRSILTTLAMIDSSDGAVPTEGETVTVKDTLISAKNFATNCLCGWSGVKDDEGNWIEFSLEEFLSWPQELSMKIVGEMAEAYNMESTQEKNSEDTSTSSE